ncbi:MAG: DnaA regulatory inactivator Hda [Bdellovibrio bacteriovorus]
MAESPRQLSLPIERVREPTLEEYLPGPNGEAVAAVTASAAGRGEPFLFLFGHPGTGKTHLLQAACRAAGEAGRQALYVPLGGAGLAPELLEDLERLDLVAVDDLDRIRGDLAWEHALFDLFNRLRERGRSLLTAAASAPDELAFDLPDLVSRLQWGPRYRLLGLSELDCERLLAETARRRGLTLAPEVVRYVMTFHPRDPGSLVELVARLDSTSLREQRRPTIPMVRQVMQEGDVEARGLR